MISAHTHEWWWRGTRWEGVPDKARLATRRYEAEHRRRILPRWLRWLVPFRRRVLHEGALWRGYPSRFSILSARWKKKRLPKLRYKGVPIQWDDFSNTMRETFVPIVELGSRATSAIYEQIAGEAKRRNDRPKLVRQLKGWQRMSPHLKPRDSWDCWRAIVASYSQGASRRTPARSRSRRRS